MVEFVLRIPFKFCVFSAIQNRPFLSGGICSNSSWFHSAHGLISFRGDTPKFHPWKYRKALGTMFAFLWPPNYTHFVSIFKMTAKMIMEKEIVFILAFCVIYLTPAWHIYNFVLCAARRHKMSIGKWQRVSVSLTKDFILWWNGVNTSVILKTMWKYFVFDEGQA